MTKVFTPVLVATALIVAGCGSDGNGRADDGPHDDATNPADFSLRDTTDYETFAGGGRYALLYHDGTLTDTVDLAFGVPVLDSGNILFLPVSASFGEPPTEDWYTIGHHVLYDGRERTQLGELVPHFEPGFSSPVVIDNRLYYWGIRESDGMLYAIRYEFSGGDIDSTSLEEQVLGTDFRWNLLPPERDDDRLIYRGQGTRWELSVSEFEVAGREEAAGD